MAILVTGGAGYIGSVMVELLSVRGHSVVVLDDLSRGHRPAVSPEIPFWAGNVGDAALLDQVFRTHQIDAVFHFAASSLVGESMRVPALYFRNNVGGVVALLAAMERHGVRRFILSSTAATYGDPVELPLTEEAPTRPTNPYGESKLLCERVLRWFGEVHGFAWAALRYFNAAGATSLHGEDHAEETHLIPLAIRAAAGQSGPLQVFGTDYSTPDGSCVRDYIHVEDLAEAHLRALERLIPGAGGPFNLGNGQGFSVFEVIRSVERVLGRAVPWSPAPRREGDPARLIASSAKASRELGWEARHSALDEIVRSAWAWHESHPHGYRTTTA